MEFNFLNRLDYSITAMPPGIRVITVRSKKYPDISKSDTVPAFTPILNDHLYQMMMLGIIVNLADEVLKIVNLTDEVLKEEESNV